MVEESNQKAGFLFLVLRLWGENPISSIENLFQSRRLNDRILTWGNKYGLILWQN